MRILIAGAGIGGLTTALALHRHGIDCVLAEQAGAIRELGVGINLLPHAVAILVELGLLERLDAVAIRTGELILTNSKGNEIWREPRGTDAGYAVPQFSIHRGNLQLLLYEAVRQRLGESAVSVDRRLTSYEQRDEGVVAHLSNRAGTCVETIHADALIGADGIHSTVRAGMYPSEGPPCWNGVMMWRGAADWPRFLTGRSMIVAGGTSNKLVVYPIAPGSTPEHRLTNWGVCVKICEAGARPPRREDWSRPGDRAQLATFLPHFAIGHLDVKALVAATEVFYEYPMCDRDPLPRWSQGRVTLLGDAAHPMYPMGSNGGSQAILDASCISRCLASHAEPASAFAAYEAERRSSTTSVVSLNRSGGPEGVIDLVERLAPEGFRSIHDVISPQELQAIMNRYATTAGFAKEQVNA